MNCAMSSAPRAWKSSPPQTLVWLALLACLAPALLAALSACTPGSPAAPAPTPTGPLFPKDQAIEMGLQLCASGRLTAVGEPSLDVAELTTNQAIAARLGRPPWAGLPADSPVWLVKFTGLFTIAQPPAQGSTPAPALGPFPSCWAIIEARTGALGTIYIPEN